MLSEGVNQSTLDHAIGPDFDGGALRGREEQVWLRVVLALDICKNLIA
jgi:hypothetical protein